LTAPTPRLETPRRPVRALVLSGGGARGAYEAGVLDYILDTLPQRLGFEPRIDVVCGTSVGAIHACFVAATAHEADRGRRLRAVWEGFRVGDVLPLSTRDLLGLPRRIFGFGRMAIDLRSGALPDRLYGLLDTRALERVVRSAIPWRSLRRNLRHRLLDAVCLACTEIATGRVVCFVENRERRLDHWTRDRTVVGRTVRVMPDHALASAAIPMLFPAVRLGDHYFADGGLRMNTPLSPAIHLGADRVLVIALRARDPDQHEQELERARVAAYGNPLFLFGKVLNALLLDHVDTDLARMRLMNEILRDGREAFGPEFVERLNGAGLRDRVNGYKQIDDLVIRPSEDPGVLAADVLAGMRRAGDASALLRFFVRSLNASGVPNESDLLSYLLFDGAFAAPMVALGRADAAAHEDELVRFFTD